MAEHDSPVINLRCPSCFQREVDVVLRAGPDGTMHCPKCSYTGSRQDVFAIYGRLRDRFRLRNTRLPVETQRSI